jgi:hypothetical protein
MQYILEPGCSNTRLDAKYRGHHVGRALAFLDFCGTGNPLLNERGPQEFPEACRFFINSAPRPGSNRRLPKANAKCFAS